VIEYDRATGHFLRGRYSEAAHAARHALQSIPSLSLSRGLLAAALAKLGRIEEAKAIGLHVLALNPSFRANRFCAARGVPSALAERGCLSAAGLRLSNARDYTSALR
jgi:adenylate cyclase